MGWDGMGWDGMGWGVGIERMRGVEGEKGGSLTRKLEAKC